MLQLRGDRICHEPSIRPTIAPVEFIDRVIKRDEKGEPFSLLEMALRRDPCGELVFRLVVLSGAKKERQDVHGLSWPPALVGGYEPAHVKLDSNYRLGLKKCHTEARQIKS